MITIICGTNRPNSNTHKYVEHYAQELRSKTSEKVEVLCLENVQEGMLKADMYNEANVSDALKEAQDNILIPSDKFIFITPEYNGSIPGVVKLFIDALSVRKIKETFKGKKALLTGVAMGRAGNLRGMEHLTGMLHHIGITVHPNKLPISGCHLLLDDAGKLKDQGTKDTISQQLDDFLAC